MIDDDAQEAEKWEKIFGRKVKIGKLEEGILIIRRIQSRGIFIIQVGEEDEVVMAGDSEKWLS